MMYFVPLLLTGILFPAIQAKQFTKCELYRELSGLSDYDFTLQELICVIFHISGYDSQTVLNNNGSTEYGLFQISNKSWCRDNKFPESENICNISCQKFLDDDLTDDVMCVKKILDRKGIDYWLAHKALCSEKLDQWSCKKL
ncbi:alpha-lactalbumin [Sorex fumeus]|uniref:alpha-lactalbumin n=1 Tax=Sorex fumeus TaxID=62283 RepID=UPI0024AD3DA2|nr:alpha-lactalbumin [Sorex fumeus]